HSAGVVDVAVTTPSGASAPAPADQFSYNPAAPSVTGLDLTTASTAGGPTVTVSGANFTDATAVFFGSVPAASLSVNSDGSLAAVAPVHAPGTVHVIVATVFGDSAPTPASQFTFTADANTPAVTGLSASAGPAGGGTV